MFQGHRQHVDTNLELLLRELAHHHCRGRRLKQTLESGRRSLLCRGQIGVAYRIQNDQV